MLVLSFPPAPISLSFLFSPSPSPPAILILLSKSHSGIASNNSVTCSPSFTYVDIIHQSSRTSATCIRVQRSSVGCLPCSGLGRAILASHPPTSIITLSPFSSSVPLRSTGRQLYPLSLLLFALRFRVLERLARTSARVAARLPPWPAPPTLRYHPSCARAPLGWLRRRGHRRENKTGKCSPCTFGHSLPSVALVLQS